MQGKSFMVHWYIVGKIFTVLILTRMKTTCIYIGTQNKISRENFHGL